jgi:hypothetical protein
MAVKSFAFKSLGPSSYLGLVTEHILANNCFFNRGSINDFIIVVVVVVVVVGGVVLVDCRTFLWYKMGVHI